MLLTLWDAPVKRQNPNVSLVSQSKYGQLDDVILTMPCDCFTTMGVYGSRRCGKPNHMLFDVKYVLTPSYCDVKS